MVAGQRVRVVGALPTFLLERESIVDPELVGCCGTVVEAARAMPPPGVDGCAVVTQPEQLHLVQLDGHPKRVRVSPYAIEPWPRIGQLVQWSITPGDPDRSFTMDVARVESMYAYQQWPEKSSMHGHIICVYYSLMRTVYARSNRVANVEGDGAPIIGSRVRLLWPHTDYEWSEDERPIVTKLPSDPEEGFYVRAICEDCDSIELTHRWTWLHTDCHPVSGKNKSCAE